MYIIAAAESPSPAASWSVSGESSAGVALVQAEAANDKPLDGNKDKTPALSFSPEEFVAMIDICKDRLKQLTNVAGLSSRCRQVLLQHLHIRKEQSAAEKEDVSEDVSKRKIGVPKLGACEEGSYLKEASGPQADVDECAAACAVSPKCTSFAFCSARHAGCVRKQNLCALYSICNTIGTNGGAWTGFRTYNVSTACTSSLLRDASRGVKPASSAGAPVAKSAEECAKLCARASGCALYVWHGPAFAETQWAGRCLLLTAEDVDQKLDPDTWPAASHATSGLCNATTPARRSSGDDDEIPEEEARDVTAGEDASLNEGQSAEENTAASAEDGAEVAVDTEGSGEDGMNTEGGVEEVADAEVSVEEVADAEGSVEEVADAEGGVEEVAD
eukprot:gene7784-9249_t